MGQKLEKSQKEGMDLDGRKEKILQGSHTVSSQGDARPSNEDTGGIQRQAAEQDLQVVAAILGEQVVYPLCVASLT